MIISSTRSFIAGRRPQGRVLAALLLSAFAVVVLAGSALAASLVKNGSFEKDTDGDGVPNSWVGTSLTAADKRVCNQSYAGACSFRMTGPGSIRVLKQTILYPGGGPAGTYDLSLWYKRKDLPADGAYFYITFEHVDGSDNDAYVAIPAGTGTWAKGSSFAESTEDYDEIQVWLLFTADSGKVWVDKVKLVLLP